jgi:hypothetical protein
VTTVTLTLEETFLKIRCNLDGLRTNRRLSESDFDRFKQWSNSYLTALGRESDPPALRKIGVEMCHWVDAGERCLERVLSAAEPPLVL